MILQRILFATGLLCAWPAHAQAPVAAYSLNEGTGITFHDSSGNNNNGMLTGAGWAPGKYGFGLSFGGAGYGFVPNASSIDIGGSALTVEFWAQRTGSNVGDQVVMGKDGAIGFYQYGFEMDSGGWPRAFLEITNGQLSEFTYATQYAINTWQHFAFTYDGATVRLYLNGTLNKSYAQTGAIRADGKPLHFGSDKNLGQKFTGLLDEVRIYNVALTQAQIQADMNTSVSAPTDTQPPTAPSNLMATVASSSQINLNWTASTDNMGVVGYLLDRCQGVGCSSFSQIATPTTTGYSDSGLAAGTSYSYRARAKDAAGNVSGYSNVSSAVTASNIVVLFSGTNSASYNPTTRILTFNCGSTMTGTINPLLIQPGIIVGCGTSTYIFMPPFGGICLWSGADGKAIWTGSFTP